jgi:uncharacterized protein YjbJ (UPF0337 family)
MNKKQLRGTARSLIGELEQMAGKLTGNRGLQRRGMARKISGKTEALAGNALAAITAAIRRR